MSSNFVRFKENASKSRPNLGLEADGRSKFPNCVDLYQPALGPDGRWLTGMDENAHSVLIIQDATEREAKREALKKERESLESLTNIDLSGKSAFWNTYWVEVNPNKPLNLTNPLDRIKYNVLLVSDVVAPTLKDANRAEYKNAKYYIAREFEDVTDRLEKRRNKDEASAALLELLKVPNRAVLVAKYLELPINESTPPENVYDIFGTYLDNDEKLDSVNKFLSAVRKSPEEINIKLIFADAVKWNVIRRRDNLYQRGNITLGREPKEVITFLTDVKNSGELLSIQEEVEMKRKFG
jgi:hypothetical protein